jgi:hypothetical protein
MTPCERKEVKKMNYSKPEITVLGNAASVIHGSKQSGSESIQPQNLVLVSDCELDD